MPEATRKYVTIPERKAREAARRNTAAQAVIERLRAFVHETGHRGRFIVFGSVASGAIRFTSDFDVLVDFPPDLESAAWSAVEAACREWNITEDVHSTMTTKPDFVEGIMTRPVEIIE
jgi:predicted nucleotidyltransferase